MREAVAAAVGALVAAAGIAGGTVALAEDEQYVLDPLEPVVTLPPVLPPVSIPLPAPPIVTEDDTSRRIPETFTVVVEKPTDDSPVAATVEVSSTDRRLSEDTGMGTDVEQWRPLVTTYFGAELVDTALCLMALESGGNPGATNPTSGASGLMQVLPSWADTFGVTRDALYDPGTNLSISKALYDDGGWGHWSPWNRGECH
jgi:Transglycosylase SLT domain